MDNFFTYLPISENNMRWELYLTGVGTATISAGQSYPPPGHPLVYDFKWENGRVLPEYQILFIAEGEGIFESKDLQQIHVTQNNVILLFPGQWHRYKPLNNSGWKEYWLSWNGERLYWLLRKGLIAPNAAVLDVKKPQQMAAAFERILEHVQLHPAQNSNVLSAYAMEVLTLAIENIQTSPIQKDAALPSQYVDSVDNPLVFKALQMIWNQSYRNFNINDILQAIPITRRTLERQFSKALGRSVGTEITRCRLERAKHLLTNTALPIKQIAMAAGFTNSDWMSRVFRRELKISPGQYRISAPQK